MIFAVLLLFFFFEDTEAFVREIRVNFFVDATKLSWSFHNTELPMPDPHVLDL